MTREEIIAFLETCIKRMKFAQAHPQVHPKWKDQQCIDDGLQKAKNLLERTKAGDEAAIQEISDLLDIKC
jgi:hypothetical protein